ncbi:MAG: D-alanyl-D-alanine carboxypeptidase [Cyanobacteria bacterium P01_G01_bin.67]
MLDFIAGSIFASWLNVLGQPQPELKPLESILWERTTVFQLPQLNQDPLVEAKIASYLQNLTAQGANGNRQGIWVQSDWTVLGSNQGVEALSGASLTKIATTLAALNQWGSEHQFLTDIYLMGEINEGVVEGDLLVQGSGDPLLVWEEAIAIGNALNQLGIREIQGDLLVTDKFYMNYQDRPLKAGELFKQGIDRTQWQGEVSQQYRQMPVGTMSPEVTVTGKVQLIKAVPPQAKLLMRHRSLPLAEILRQMNLYSNNRMAQILTNLVGGVGGLTAASQEIAGVSATEIELVNGSGLGESNRISPRAVCQMLRAIDRLLHPSALNLSHLFPTAGRDRVGTVQERNLPPGIAIKTGTLDRVSALAGAIPTSDRGVVYFSIINYGSEIKNFRQQQDVLLNKLVQPWQLELRDSSLVSDGNWYLGDPQRNELIKIN